MIVHLGTVVQSTFGVLDAEGNVVQTVPLQMQIPVPSLAAFAEARGVLAARMAELREQERMGDPARAGSEEVKADAGNSSDRPSAGSE